MCILDLFIYTGMKEDMEAKYQNWPVLQKIMFLPAVSRLKVCKKKKVIKEDTLPMIQWYHDTINSEMPDNLFQYIRISMQPKEKKSKQESVCCIYYEFLFILFNSLYPFSELPSRPKHDVKNKPLRSKGLALVDL